MPGGKPTKADVLSMAEARAMVCYLRDNGDLRGAALVALASGYGLRVGDAVSLTWRAVLDDAGGIRATVNFTEEKTGSKRIVHTFPFVGRTLREWADAQGMPDLDAPIVPVSTVTGWRIVKRTAEAMGKRGNISPHSLRKAFCTFAYEQTHDPVLTCDVTGHANPANLMAYIGRERQAVEDVWSSMMRAERKLEKWHGKKGAAIATVRA